MIRSLILLLIFPLVSSLVSAKEKPNVLFIVLDDLRPEVKPFGPSQIISPNINQLADDGVVFTNAYCQQAICAASRNSFLTGLRPDALGIYDLSTFFRNHRPDIVSLPQHFKNNGYRAEAIGKIYHEGHGNKSDELSWSIPNWNRKNALSPKKKIKNGDTMAVNLDYPTIDKKRLPFYKSNAKMNDLVDVANTNTAIKRLKALKDEPFFLAVGYYKPHLPFVAPAKYWNLYDPNKIKVPSKEAPEEMPKIAYANFEELRKYYGMPSKREARYVDDQEAKKLIHGYYACVSYVDEQIGRLVQTLKDLKLYDNTVIVLIGDHGFKLGDYGSWCKHTNFEIDTRVPLIVKASEGVKGKTESLAELVDIYPTLCELSGLPKPKHLEGQSLSPILSDLDYTVNEVAISQYPRGKKLGYDYKQEFMGYSITDGTYRYTRWQSYENPKNVIEKELYDVSSTRLPSKNLVNDPKYKAISKELDKRLSEELAGYDFFKPKKKQL